MYQFHQFTFPLHGLYLNNYLGHETTYNAHVPLLTFAFHLSTLFSHQCAHLLCALCSN